MFGPVKYSHKSVDDISTDIAKDEQNIGIEDQAQLVIRGGEIISKLQAVRFARSSAAVTWFLRCYLHY